MRRMVTLEPEVVARLKEIARERGIPFKEALNTAIRRGLDAGKVSTPYRTPTRSLGLRADVDLDRALRLATSMEDDEIVRRVESRE